jgi:SAM-dependent methyltransferase
MPWADGYISEIEYTFGYYVELNPYRLLFPFLNTGLTPLTPQFSCELGFGQGLNINIHASAQHGTAFWGTDFNPSQAGFAREVAAASGNGAVLQDDAFADFASRSDLPDFDFIGLHGIWSWISDANRAVIVDFLRRKLKVGGVLYISYNTQPGWAVMAPVRHLMTEHATLMGGCGQGIANRIEAALEFTDRLIATAPLYMRANPQVEEKFKKLKEHNRNYLAHEYFNRDWLPMPFGDMVKWLEPAKLSFACSAHYLDHLDALNLTPEQQAFLKDIPDPNFRETVRDYMVCQQFRRDYWVKGPRKMTPLEQVEAIRKQRVILTANRPDVSLKATGALGEATLKEEVYGPILDALADNKPKTIGQVETLVADKGINFAALTQAAMVLIGTGALSPAQEDKTIAKARTATDKLNAHLMQKARSSTDISFLASPVTGGGVTVGRFKQLFLLAKASGRKTPEDWATHVWQILSAQNQRLIKDGATLESPEDNLAELTAQARQFAAKELPILHALGIA